MRSFCLPSGFLIFRMTALHTTIVTTSREGCPSPPGSRSGSRARIRDSTSPIHALTCPTSPGSWMRRPSRSETSVRFAYMAAPPPTRRRCRSAYVAAWPASAWAVHATRWPCTGPPGPRRPSPCPDRAGTSARRGPRSVASRGRVGQADELLVVGDEPDVDLGADADHVVLPAGRHELTGGRVHGVVGDVDGHALDLPPDGLGPVAGDADDVAVLGVAGAEHRAAQDGTDRPV